MNNRGSAMLEVLFAIIIFGLCSSAVYPIMSKSVSQTVDLEQTIEANRVLSLCTNTLLSSGTKGTSLFSQTQDDGKTLWNSETYISTTQSLATIGYGDITAKITLSDHEYMEVPVQNKIDYTISNDATGSNGEDGGNPYIKLDFLEDGIDLVYQGSDRTELANFTLPDVDAPQVMTIAYYYDIAIEQTFNTIHTLDFEITNKPSNFLVNIYFIKRNFSGTSYAGSDLNSQKLNLITDNANSITVYTNAKEDLYNSFNGNMSDFSSNILGLQTVDLTQGHNKTRELVSYKAQISILDKTGASLLTQEVLIS